MRGGWFEDTRMMWGEKRAGLIFHRAVTSLVVLYIHNELQTRWLPTISDPTTIDWIAARCVAGYTLFQQLPAIVKGFLDDFFFIIAGSTADQENAQSLILDALHFLGFALSEAKLVSEGKLSTRIDILGHCFDLTAMTRGVALYKQTRARDTIADLLQQKTWKLESLQSLLGLLQSVQRGVPRRWPLAPAYAVLHSQGPNAPKTTALRPSEDAVRILRRVDATIHLQKDLKAILVPWPTPISSFAEMQPESDASKHYGFASVLRHTDPIAYFTRGKWPLSPGADTNIDLLEALAIVIAGATFAPPSSQGDELRSDRTLPQRLLRSTP
jgi:hypothetical protein